MYRMTLFFRVADDAAAQDLCDEVATLCDERLGRISSDESKLPYFLTYAEIPEDEEASQRWVAENLMTPETRGIIIPRPIGELN